MHAGVPDHAARVEPRELRPSTSSNPTGVLAADRSLRPPRAADPVVLQHHLLGAAEHRLRAQREDVTTERQDGIIVGAARAPPLRPARMRLARRPQPRRPSRRAPRRAWRPSRAEGRLQDRGWGGLSGAASISPPLGARLARAPTRLAPASTPSAWEHPTGARWSISGAPRRDASAAPTATGSAGPRSPRRRRRGRGTARSRAPPRASRPRLRPGTSRAPTRRRAAATRRRPTP